MGCGESKHAVATENTTVSRSKSSNSIATNNSSYNQKAATNEEFVRESENAEVDDDDKGKETEKIEEVKAKEDDVVVSDQNGEGGKMEINEENCVKEAEKVDEKEGSKMVKTHDHDHEAIDSISNSEGNNGGVIEGKGLEGEAVSEGEKIKVDEGKEAVRVIEATAAGEEKTPAPQKETENAAK